MIVPDFKTATIAAFSPQCASGDQLWLPSGEKVAEGRMRGSENVRS